MSEDGGYDDEDEYFEYEDIPFNEAVSRSNSPTPTQQAALQLTSTIQEDLAAHSLPSPVWINYDPAWETASFVSDWEYYSDEYWEQESPSKRRKRSEEGDEAKRDTKDAQKNSKKRRKAKAFENPSVPPSQPSLAASSVVWKSKKESLNCITGPIVAEGHNEKVSILKDWRRQFKTLIISKPEKSHPHNGVQANDPLEDELNFDLHEHNALSPPPMTLEELEGFPVRSRLAKEPVRESSSKDYGASFHDGSLNMEDDLDQEIPVLEVDGITEEYYRISSADDVKTPKSTKRTHGWLQEYKDTSIHMELRDRNLRNPSQTIRRFEKTEPGRPLGDKSTVRMDKDKSDDNPKISHRNTVFRGKRKAQDDLPESVAFEATSQTRKRGRPKKQHSLDVVDANTEGVSPVDSDVAMPAKKKKRGRPKRQKPSPLSEQIDEHNLEGSVENKSAPHPIANGTSLAGKKRKEQSSEDALFKPAAKRRSSARQGSTAEANANMMVAKTQKSRGSKRT